MAVDERPTFLASYPKSGNTWVRMLVMSYFYGREDGFASVIDIGEYSFQAPSPIPVGRLTMEDQALLRPAAMMHLMRIFDGQRILCKTHHASGDYGGIPLFPPAFCERAIYIVRDPRDVCCSAADFFGQTHRETARMMAGPIDLNEFTEERERERMTHRLGTWSDHTGSWRRQDRVPVLTVRYEDLHEDCHRELRRVLEFLGETEIDEERLDMAVEANRFENVKDRERHIGFEESSPKSDEGFFRKGEAEGWREEIDPKAAAKIEADHATEMGHYGYEPAHCGAPTEDGLYCARRTGGTPCWQHETAERDLKVVA